MLLPQNTHSPLLPRIAGSLGLLLLLFPFSLSFGEPDSSTLELEKIFSNFEKKIRRLKLKNGLRLILMKRGFAPTAAVYIKFKAGSYDEEENSYGIAHMLEHMLFKGTRLVGTRDFDKEKKYLQLSVRYAHKMDIWRRRQKEAIRKNAKNAENEKDERNAKSEKNTGNEKSETAQKEIDKWKKRMAILAEQSRRYVIPEQDARIYALHGARGYNAYTSADLTNYQVQIPVNKIEVWARLESDRMENAVLRNYYTEREVVREERRMRVDNRPRSAFWEKFRMAIYGFHPYGRSVIGPMESIQFLNYNQAMRFYKKHYAPNNTVIAVVGNIDLDETEKIVRKYFGKLPSSQKHSRHSHSSSALTSLQSQPLNLLCRGGKSPLIYLAWLKPPMPDPNDLYLEILSKILAGSPETRLQERLITKEKAAVSVFVQNGVIGNRAENLFLIGAEPALGISLDKIQAAIFDELAKIRKNGPSEEELGLVRRRERLNLINGFQSNSRLADSLSYFELIVSDYRSLFRYNKFLDTIQVPMIQKAASRFLQPQNVMTARLEPQSPSEKQNTLSCSEN